MWLRTLASMSIIAALTGAAPAAAATVTGKRSEPGIAWVSQGQRGKVADEQSMRNTHKAFVPDFLTIVAGSSVRFPNDDQFFHSIYSESDVDGFDIGFYDTGPGKVVSFDKPGIVEVRCHVHARMYAVIAVVDGPFARTQSANETFSIANVAPGSHVLHTWTPTGGEKHTTIRVADAGSHVALEIFP